MKNFIKTTSIAFITMATFSGSAQAGQTDHAIAMKWSAKKTVVENFESAQETITKYCSAQARDLSDKSLSFRGRYEKRCVDQLLEDLVDQIGSRELKTLYTELKRNG